MDGRGRGSNDDSEHRGCHYLERVPAYQCSAAVSAGAAAVAGVHAAAAADVGNHDLCTRRCDDGGRDTDSGCDDVRGGRSSSWAIFASRW